MRRTSYKILLAILIIGAINFVTTLLPISVYIGSLFGSVIDISSWFILRVSLFVLLAYGIIRFEKERYSSLFPLGVAIIMYFFCSYGSMIKLNTVRWWFDSRQERYNQAVDYVNQLDYLMENQKLPRQYGSLSIDGRVNFLPGSNREDGWRVTFALKEKFRGGEWIIFYNSDKYWNIDDYYEKLVRLRPKWFYYTRSW